MFVKQKLILQIKVSGLASNAKDPGFDSRHPHNRQDWWHSPVNLLLGDKDMKWLEESSLVTLLVN